MGLVVIDREGLELRGKVTYVRLNNERHKLVNINSNGKRTHRENDANSLI